MPWPIKSRRIAKPGAGYVLAVALDAALGEALVILLVGRQVEVELQLSSRQVEAVDRWIGMPLMSSHMTLWWRLTSPLPRPLPPFHGQTC
ncbi:hypothetical protein T492DRAFT_1070939 [Pavlovales sp. CCMP2436]|nr:hypothetical protein T492DRAFT_1070939 [Pavlovales sp. CCMP2436]